MSAILETKNLSMNFGGLTALDRLEIDVLQGEITALIGPNGAGKTTLFNCITGIYSPTAGNIFITPPGGRRREITGLNINKVTEGGVARTFQNIRLFPDMTVLENVMVGRHCRASAGILGAILRDALFQIADREADRGDLLTEVVMQFARQARSLLFLRVDQSSAESFELLFGFFALRYVLTDSDELHGFR